MKKLNPWYLAAIASVAPLGALGGMMGAFAGHVAVLAITMGIFVGTLSLNRTPQNQHSSVGAQTVEQSEDRAAKRRSLPGLGASRLRGATDDERRDAPQAPG